MTAAGLAVCGLGLLVLSGYEPFSMILVAGGVVVLAGGAALAIYTLVTRRKDLFSPERKRSSAGLYRDTLVAIFVVVVGSGPLVMSGHQADHASALRFGAVFLAASSLYSAFAAFRYRRARRAEDARTPERAREDRAQEAPGLGPGRYTRFWAMRVGALGFTAVVLLTAVASAREPWVLVIVAAALLVCAAGLALAAAAAGRDVYGPWRRALGRRRNESPGTSSPRNERAGGQAGAEPRGPDGQA